MSDGKTVEGTGLSDYYDKYDSLSDVITGVRQTVSIDINVASLATVKSVYEEYDKNKKYGIVNVSPFPLGENEEEHTIQGYFFKKRSYDEGDIVLCVYTDKDFRSSLQNGRLAGTTSNTEYHSYSYCIIIPIFDI